MTETILPEEHSSVTEEEWLSVTTFEFEAS